MKVGVATTLSVAGVIAAGAAAFALNSAVLSSDSSKISASNVATTLASTPDGAVSAADEQITTNSTQVSDNVTTYQVGSAGSIVVDSASGVVNVTDIVPSGGWTAEPARTEPDGTVKVHFVKGSVRIEFAAIMTAGKVAVQVKNETPPAAGNANPTRPSVPPALSGGDGDGDHEGFGDDDGAEHHDHHDGDHEDNEDDD